MADKLLYLLKTRGGMSSQHLASLQGLTSMGVRKQLLLLQAQGLVQCALKKTGVGRPAQIWQLTESGHARFPDRHGELTVQLLTLLVEQLGQPALDTLIQAREQQSLLRYQSQLAACADLPAKVAALATMRNEEGYMAEVQAEEGGSWLLLENHCPICAAARQCQGFCRSEWAQFQQLFAAEASVERVEYQLAGGARCVYRISPIIAG